MPTNHYKKTGLVLLLAPAGLILAVIILFAVLNTFISTLSPQYSIVFTVINFALGALGLIGVIGVIVGIPLGIILLIKSGNYHELTEYDARSGPGEASTVPSELIGKWNWGAAGLTWIWGVYFNVWISLLNFVPFLNVIFWIILGFKCNEWAWQKMRWKSVEDFKETQARWKPWGIAFVALRVLGVAFTIIVALLPELMRVGV